MKEFTKCTDYSHYSFEEEPQIFLEIRSRISTPLSAETMTGETTRKCFYIEVCNNGAVRFLDGKKQLLACVEASGSHYEKAIFRWKPTGPSLEFGEFVEVDNYPHCDGEYDRWDIKWKVRRQVCLNEADISVAVE